VSLRDLVCFFCLLASACVGTGTGNPPADPESQEPKDEEPAPDKQEHASEDPLERNPAGYVQKGPFIAGSSVTLRELDEKLGATGRSFETSIRDNTGAFSFGTVQLVAAVVELGANGFFFNEVSGVLSNAPIQLRSLADLTDRNSVNVNVMGHLELERVRTLIAQDLPFADARAQAHLELLDNFGIDAEGVGDAETLDLTRGEKGDAVLTAISIIVLGNRTEAPLTELLSALSEDFAPDGEIGAKRLEALANVVVLYDGEAITNKLRMRFQELGVEAVLPDFAPYIDAFIAKAGPLGTACFDGITVDSAGAATHCAATLSGCNDGRSYGIDCTVGGECVCTVDGTEVARNPTTDACERFMIPLQTTYDNINEHCGFELVAAERLGR
jgi:hypothetical protein